MKRIGGEEGLDQELGVDEDRGLEIEKVIEVEIDIRARDPEDGVVVQDPKIEDVRDHLEDGKHRRKGLKR